MQDLTSMRQVDGLCEIVYDVAQNLHCRLNGMDDNEGVELMDRLGGSRGLFWDHAYKWAQEYHAEWESLTEAKRTERAENYLIDIDKFVLEKFKLLLQYLPAYISVQVVPVIHYPRTEAQNEHAEAQPAGPTEDTTCWGVYLRDRSGQVKWVADSFDEDTAMLLGGALAAKHGIEIEPQPWKEKK